MFRRATSRRRWTAFMAACFVTASVYHVTALFYYLDESPPWRHGLFAMLDMCCVYGFLKKPRYFLLLFLAFTLQQYYTHGMRLMETWMADQQIHWLSVFVLAFMPVGLVSLLAEIVYADNSIFSNPEVQ